MPDFSFELARMADGYRRIAGIDEAGRGPLAGPVSAAAVVLPDGFSHDLLDDSKKLTEKRRELLYEELLQNDEVLWSHSFAEVGEIEEKNILRATHAAMARAAEGLSAIPDYCLIDGLAVPGFPIPSEGIVKGDGKSMSIAAASIIAKVARDRQMRDYAKQYPGYGFEKHKGYGTKQHMQALKELGPCPIHRRTFAPIAQLLAQMDLPM
ncbi:ribonuclease HII [Verrucomicrobiaceae bacterium N1E253]|uniref:Ribonuclease HII n=1 Tax=Oceaniferula marina TaxID=2748318 RepID=A0A851GLZ6_9BACT|nr:ribonuclease HII [Oceaniferula marina]NWK56851.1 ribonuclease HII [Oceaniferula marina]